MIVKMHLMDIGLKKDLKSFQMKKSIILSLIIKIISVGVNLLFVPLTLDYINKEKYGIWLTVTSIMSWLNLLDIGFGNGLRNKFAEAVVNNDIKLQKQLVQTTLFSLISISVLIISFSYILFYNISWSEFLGVNKSYSNELKNLFFALILMFSIQFVLQIYNSIQFALQKPEMVSLNILLGNVFGLLGVYVLKHYCSPSLLYLGLTIMGGNVLVLIMSFIQYFFVKRSDLLKDFSLPTFENLKNISSLGFKFFVVNIAFVVQYQTSNILISKFLSAEKVAEFNVAFKLFNVLGIIFGLFMSPVWSLATNAYVSKDFSWIKTLIKKLLGIWVLICIASLMILILSPYLYKEWLGGKIYISTETNIGVAIVICSSCLSSIFINILNGLSKVTIQFYLSIVVMIIFFPLAYFLAIELGMGIIGICITIVITNFSGILVAPLQLYLIFKREGNE